MKQLTLILTYLLVVSACNSVKRNQKMLLQGNYDEAIELAVKKISNDRNDKQVGQHILLLEEAYAKAVSDDNRRISYLQKLNTPEAIRERYYIYRRLVQRQDRIRPLLPLTNPITGQQAYFSMADYTNALVQAQGDFADALFTEANGLMQKNTVLDYRDAYEVLEELKSVQSNYPDVDRLLDDARFYGTDFVLVTLNNRSNVIMPRGLEQELLNFNTFNLDNFWTEYHSERQRDVTYHFGIVLNFRDIAFSPERVGEREFKRSKTIIDGFRYKLDRNGNKIKDEDGNYIKIDIEKDVTARITYTTQTKSVLVGGDVTYRDLQSGRNIDKHPLSSEFVFENVFARFRGDERALTDEDRRMVRNEFIRFPTNAQMLLDAGDDIKARLKGILKENSLR